MAITNNLKSVAVMTGVAVAAAGLFFLLREHWWHILPFAPYSIYLLFLACPLMHLFMHHGHGGHGAHQHGEASGPAQGDQASSPKPR
jgi:hypothetical protein